MEVVNTNIKKEISNIKDSLPIGEDKLHSNCSKFPTLIEIIFFDEENIEFKYNNN